MADDWIDIEPQQGAVSATALVRFGLSQMRNGPFRARILIRKPVLDKLGLENWRVNVRLGSAINAHRLAIVPDPQGKFELQEMGKTKGGGTFRIMLPEIDRFPRVKMAVAEAGYEIASIAGRTSALFVNLPKPCWSEKNARAFEAVREGR